jgi:hypothetical protein
MLDYESRVVGMDRDEVGALLGACSGVPFVVASHAEAREHIGVGDVPADVSCALRRAESPCGTAAAGNAA